MQYLYQKICNKQNILSEASLIQKSLKSYKQILQSNDEISELEYIRDYILSSKSKPYYNILLEKRATQARLKYWSQILKITFSHEDIKLICLGKIISINYNKLQEFNYKVLHNILPCGNLVNKWDRSVSDTCTICNVKEDVYHMLYDCVLAKRIWNYINIKLNVNIDINVFIYGSDNNEVNYITSLISFLIFKFWILCNKNIWQRHIRNILPFILSELKQEVLVLDILKKDTLKTSVIQILSN